MGESTARDWKDWLPRPAALAAWSVLAAVFVWTYWHTLCEVILVWWGQPEYGHGFFVVPFALFLLWFRRDMIWPLPERGSWFGLVLLALWALTRWTSAYFFFTLLDPPSWLFFFAGLALLLGGWRALLWAWPSVLFLVFMMPLPGFLAGALSWPLQRLGTAISVFIIQTVGIPAVAQGNVIVLTDTQLGVVEACSGLRMLMLFFAVCIGAALILRRPPWERALIVVSAVPIAILANVGRITITAVLHELVSTELADRVFHDFAGLLMMPLALVMLWGEIALISKLLLEPMPTRPMTLGRAFAQGSRDSAGGTR